MQIGMHQLIHLHAGSANAAGILLTPILAVDVGRQRQSQRQPTAARRSVEQQRVRHMTLPHRAPQRGFRFL